MSVELKRGWIFVSTGSAAFDFWGGARHGDNLYSDCVLALDARTGRRIWYSWSYAIGNRQLVVIGCGGGNRQQTPAGDEFVAFSP